MKDFIALFIGFSGVIYAFFLLGGGIVFQNFYALIAVFGFLAAVVCFAFMRQSNKIKQLEKRIAALEHAEN